MTQVKIEGAEIVYTNGSRVSLFYSDHEKKVLEDGSFVAVDVPVKSGPNGGYVLQTLQDIEKQNEDRELADEERRVASLVKSASSFLEKYSLVVQRAYEAGVPFPQDWKAFGATLRLIAKGEHPGPIPKQPETYPDER